MERSFVIKEVLDFEFKLPLRAMISKYDKRKKRYHISAVSLHTSITLYSIEFNKY